MRGFTIHATDGDIGSVDEFLFDDEQWTIRYLVVNTGGWLTGRLVLVSPIAFRSVDWDRETFDVALTRQQVEQSPSIATDQPVSRQQEECSRYYGYPYYWDGLGLWGAGMYPRIAYLSAVNSTYGETATERQPAGDPHLRSARAVTGYAIQARDGDLGHVEDFIVDDESWVLRYMVVDTRNWWPGKHVLVSPRWIESVRWTQSSVVVDLLRETIQGRQRVRPIHAAQSGVRDQAPPGSPARAVLGGDLRRVIPPQCGGLHRLRMRWDVRHVLPGAVRGWGEGVPVGEARESTNALPTRFVQDCNILDKLVTDGAGHLRYSCQG